VNGLNLPNGLVFNRTLSGASMALTAANPLLAAGPAETVGDEDLTAASLRAMNEAAIALWINAGLPQRLVERLRSVELVIADLPDLALASAVSGAITVDRNAAGHGWFIDSTADVDEEYSAAAADGALGALAGAPAEDRMDLLTVLLHEQAHLLGLEHTAGDGAAALLLPTLDAGARRKLDPALVDLILAS
jgi:hypothetical protein